MTPPVDWVVRPANASDLNFIYSTWLNSYRNDSSIGKSTRKSVFFAEYYSVLDAILEKPETKVVVACLPDEPNVILGFVVCRPLILDYCFTKEAFRRLGIARSLVEAIDGAGDWSELSYTHRTRFIERFIKRFDFLTYNPFLLFERLTAKNPR